MKKIIKLFEQYNGDEEKEFSERMELNRKIDDLADKKLLSLKDLPWNQGNFNHIHREIAEQWFKIGFRIGYKEGSK